MRYLRAHCVALCLVLGIAGPSTAQPNPEVKNGRVTIEMTLSPATYLKPVSRSHLLPEFAESIPGNRVQMFLRCFMEQDTFFGKAETDRRTAWNDMPLKDLPHADVKNYGGRLAERDMYDAARMTSTDWQLWYFARRDGFGTLLPDVQKMRSLAQVLKTRVRAQIAANDFPGAIHTLKTIFGLARTLEGHPTIIGHLVGAAIADTGISAIEEFVQQPGSPNLFWALTDLPSPLLSLRPGLEGERSFISHEFNDLKNAVDPVNDAAIIRKVEVYEPLLKMDENKSAPPRADMKSMKDAIESKSKNNGEVDAARKRLIQSGLNPAHVAVWRPLHVIVLDEVVQYETARDEAGKSFNLPFWQANPALVEAEAEMAKMKDKSIFWNLAPTLTKVKQRQAYIDQRVAYLRVIEALRLHAATHNGELPATLAAMKLPLPVDPVTGLAFEYVIKDGVATLHGEPAYSAPEKNRYYEIRLKK